MYVTKGRSSVGALMSSELLLDTFIQMWDWAIADVIFFPNGVEIQPGYTVYFTQQKTEGD